MPLFKKKYKKKKSCSPANTIIQDKKTEFSDPTTQEKDETHRATKNKKKLDICVPQRQTVQMTLSLLLFPILFYRTATVVKLEKDDDFYFMHAKDPNREWIESKSAPPPSKRKSLKKKKKKCIFKLICLIAKDSRPSSSSGLPCCCMSRQRSESEEERNYFTFCVFEFPERQRKMFPFYFPRKEKKRKDNNKNKTNEWSN